jgi:hypothetical protein
LSQISAFFGPNPPSAILNELSTVPGLSTFSSRRGPILDEASSLFADLKRDYNTGLAEALMRFYDCGNHSGRTRGRNLAVVKNSYLPYNYAA